MGSLASFEGILEKNAKGTVGVEKPRSWYLKAQVRVQMAAVYYSQICDLGQSFSSRGKYFSHASGTRMKNESVKTSHSYWHKGVTS